MSSTEWPRIILWMSCVHGRGEARCCIDCYRAEIKTEGESSFRSTPRVGPSMEEVLGTVAKADSGCAWRWRGSLESKGLLGKTASEFAHIIPRTQARRFKNIGNKSIKLMADALAAHGVHGWSMNDSHQA